MSVLFSPTKFINEVKIRPGIYSADHAVDRTVKIELWKEVGAALFQDWHTCDKATVYDRVLQLQRKWRTFRDAYTRELRNRKQYAGRTRRGYKYFKKMTFLGGYEGTISPECSEDENEALLNPQESEDSLLQEEPMELLQVKKNKIRKRNCQNSDSFVGVQPTEEMEMPFPVEIAESDTDSDKLFLLSFLPEIKQLPLNIKLWARVQIANVIQEAVNCQYNNTKPGTSMESVVNIKTRRRESSD